MQRSLSMAFKSFIFVDLFLFELPVKDTSLCSYISEFPFAQGLLSNTFDGLKSVNT